MGNAITYVIGDVGGHADELLRVLDEIGADGATLVLPPDTYVVQVGDLIDRGPESRRCVELAHKAWVANPGCYIQLAGNHETNWLDEHKSFVFTSDNDAVDLVKDWAKEGGIYLAASIEGVGRASLITHAGLTGGLWTILGRPTSAGDAARLINDGWGDALHEAVSKEGGMLTKRLNKSAGVYWADARYELWSSWQGLSLPFYLIHGHSSEYDWDSDRWALPKNEVAVKWRDAAKRHSFVETSGGKIVGIDPCLKSTPSGVSWSAYKTGGVASALGRSMVDLRQRYLEESFSPGDI
jgi:hypothetical protein